MSALERLASEVGVNERTLRRAAGLGLIRTQRPSSRRLVVSESEIAWVRSHWALIGKLLSALRTERNVELAVLFGSIARGEGVSDVSDLDLLVELRHPSPGSLETLRRRLTTHVPSDVELVPLRSAMRDSRLLSEVLRDGRPLVDRGGMWPALQARSALTNADAEQQGHALRNDAHAAVGYFQRLAARRAPLSTVARR
jgi:predicted nucleotidyltransferase